MSFPEKSLCFAISWKINTFVPHHSARVVKW